MSNGTNEQISVDFGASMIDCCIDGKHVKSVKRTEFPHDILLDDHFFDTFGIDRTHRQVVVTGGKSRAMEAVTAIPEIDAIGYGGYYALGARIPHALVVSFGSGICMVSVEEKYNNIVCTRQIGTSLGGAAIASLITNLCHTSSLQEMYDLIRQGNATNIHLTIGELVGYELGGLPLDATAVSFGKSAENYNPADMAAAIVQAITENMRSLACFAAKAINVQDIIVIGKGTQFPLVADILCVDDFRFHIPLEAPYATCLGAYHAARLASQ